MLEELRSEVEGNIWLLGGGEAVKSFVEADLIDEYLLFVMPLLLGDGLPLFPPSQKQAKLRLEEAKPFENGVVTLRYVRAED
jgi:dihydrofolate reductase